MKGIYIFLADGFEDVEALGTNDVLRRAGLRSTLVGIGEEPFAQSSHGVMVGVDDNLPYMGISHEGTTEKDVLIFPGGMPGSKSLAACKPLIKIMQEHYDAGGTVAAICAAP
ncbi:MAG: DJ-1/PfpI family protein, partial [Bacteroidales bacterium]|nr:DJ-1/PfpI family protein [Bacteroidales bacterium]